jgi:hypothetical protein
VLGGFEDVGFDLSLLEAFAPIGGGGGEPRFAPGDSALDTALAVGIFKRDVRAAGAVAANDGATEPGWPMRPSKPDAPIRPREFPRLAEQRVSSWRTQKQRNSPLWPVWEPVPLIRLWPPCRLAR